MRNDNSANYNSAALFLLLVCLFFSFTYAVSFALDVHYFGCACSIPEGNAKIWFSVFYACYGISLYLGRRFISSLFKRWGSERYVRIYFWQTSAFVILVGAIFSYILHVFTRTYSGISFTIG